MANNIKKIIFLSSAVIIGSILSSCSSNNTPFEGPVRKFTVEQKPVFYGVQFEPGKTQISDDEKNAIQAFLHGFNPARGESVSVSFDSMQMNAQNTIGADRSQAVLKYLREAGFKPGVMGVPPYLGADEVAVVRMTPKLVTPNCPDWSKTPNSNFDNAAHSNFNCSNLSNLGMMVVNPMDLVEPGEMSPADANNGVMAIQRYRADKIKELPKDTPTKQE